MLPAHTSTVTLFTRVSPSDSSLSRVSPSIHAVSCIRTEAATNTRCWWRLAHAKAHGRLHGGKLSMSPLRCRLHGGRQSLHSKTATAPDANRPHMTQTGTRHLVHSYIIHWSPSLFMGCFALPTNETSRSQRRQHWTPYHQFAILAISRDLATLFH